jgi:hypothetical protein
VTVAEWLVATNYILRNTEGDAPIFGTEESNYWLGLLNLKINELYRNSRVLFDTTWDIKSLGTIIASATPTYLIQDDSLTPVEYRLIAPSDEAYIITTDDQKVSVQLIKPRQRTDHNRKAYIAGVNPQTLYFTNEIKAGENIVGGELFLPGYYMPDALDSTTDELPLPDPYWGVMSVAAEIAFGDIIYEDKAEGLNTKANNLYSQMVRANRRGTYRNPKQIPYNNYRIRDTEVS